VPETPVRRAHSNHQYVRSPHAKPHRRTDRARFCEAAGPSDRKGAQQVGPQLGEVALPVQPKFDKSLHEAKVFVKSEKRRVVL
jgi:hypothetical protein